MAHACSTFTDGAACKHSVYTHLLRAYRQASLASGVDLDLDLEGISESPSGAHAAGSTISVGA
jgi:hypothetical protein